MRPTSYDGGHAHWRARQWTPSARPQCRPVVAAGSSRMPYLAVASTSASAVTFMAVPGHEQAKDAVVIAQAYGMTASTALLTGAGRVDWRMKKGSSLPVQSSARRHLMTSEPVRDPFADHLLTPQNCALIIIDYQPVPSRSARSGPWIRKGLLAACQSSDIALEA